MFPMVISSISRRFHVDYHDPFETARFHIKNRYLQNISGNRNWITNVYSTIIIIDPFLRMLFAVLNELFSTVIKVSSVDKEAITFFAVMV